MADADAAADIPAMVQRLCRGSRVAQLQAAKDLGKLLQRQPQHKAAFTAAGGIAAALQLIQNGSVAVKEEATMLLAVALAEGAAACQALAAAGGGAVLARQLRDCAAGGEPQLRLVTVVAVEKATVPDCPNVRGGLLAAGAAPALASLLQRSAGVEEAATTAIALQRLVQGGPGSGAAIAASGGVEALVRLLRRTTDSANQVQLLAPLACLMHASLECTQAAVEAGAISIALQYIGRSGGGGSGSSSGSTGGGSTGQSTEVQVWAAHLLGVAAAADVRFRAAIVEAGGHAALVALLPRCDGGRQQQWVAGAIQQVGAAQPASEVLEGMGQNEPISGPEAEQENLPQPARPLRRICAAPGCGATRGLKCCAGCCVVRYCSTECQRKHWPAHGGECRRLQAERAAAAAAVHASI